MRNSPVTIGVCPAAPPRWLAALLAPLCLLAIPTQANAAWAPPPGKRRIRPSRRIVAPEGVATSYGSGTLIDVRGDYGLVLTNWHVVADAKGTIEVVFPDGFRSAAKVVSTDKTWDLAALAIWKPNVAPVPLASQPPQPGEPLSIAGYGSGTYRMASGYCTQYVAPGMNHPYEMVEISAAARQGDSGGPIFNSRGELAGVLFGSSFGTTSGSYCGRVSSFLTAVIPQANLEDPSYLASKRDGANVGGAATANPPAANGGAAHSLAAAAAPATGGSAVVGQLATANRPLCPSADLWSRSLMFRGRISRSAIRHRAYNPALPRPKSLSRPREN